MNTDNSNEQLTVEEINGITPCFQSKIKKAIGIEKLPVRAEEGLRKTLESFKG